MRIWVTRTGPEGTAKRLEQAGLHAVVAPVLEVRRLANVSLDVDGADALAFTSRNAVETFAALSARRDLIAYVIGQGTAAAARDVGLEDVRIADGDVEDLATLIIREGQATFVLWPGPTEPAGDLVGKLAGGGVKARLAPVYETVDSGIETPRHIDAVLIHSAKAAAAVARRLSDREAKHLTVFAISQAAAAPLVHLPFKAVAAAPRPNETALLSLITG